MQQADIILDEKIQAARAHLAEIGRFLFDRNLTDAGGGNVSIRVGDLICMSPSYSGQKWRWQLEPEDVLVVDFDRNILVGEGTLTREISVHFNLHQNYGDYGTGVIHCHPRNLMVFAAMAKPMPPVLEATRKFGVTPVVEYAPAHSPKLGQYISDSMKGREQMIRKHGAGTIAPWHGLFLMGSDIDAAFDAVERLDTNAFCLMMSQSLGASPMLAEESARMEEAIRNFRE